MLVDCQNAPLVSPHRRLPKTPAAASTLNLAGGLWCWKFYRRFMCHRDQKGERWGFEGKKGREDIHFWPLKETLHWPIKKWKISPRKPWQSLWPALSALTFFNLSRWSFWMLVGGQLASWLWGETKGYRFNPCKQPLQLDPVDFREIWMFHLTSLTCFWGDILKPGVWVYCLLPFLSVMKPKHPHLLCFSRM